jgi:2-polyprenyl-6-methoxyphenol hydroxylase-like FAD-dependent oxidoreductase
MKIRNMILIIGAGIAGLTTAIALKQKGIEFLVVEAVPEIKGLGAGISLAGNAMRVLKNLGVDEDVKNKGHQITSMVIQDKTGKYISAMDAEKLSNQYGLDNVAIHRGALHEVLLSRVDPQKIITGKKAIGFENEHDRVGVFFEDGTKLFGDGVIVADGIHSAIRKILIPDSLPRYSGYTCWRGITENKWNITKEAVETWGAEGRFGYVPIGDNKVYWFACKNAHAKDAKMMSWTIQDLELNFKSYAQPIPSILESTPSHELIWSDISDIEPLKQFAFGKLVMIGDAGHATTPNLGQGACMGMEDALAIADELSRNTSIEESFKRFEQKRIKRTTYIVNTSYQLGKIAQLENKILVQLRNFVLRMTPSWVNERQVAKVLDV